jgi:uncharacterized membrane protein YfcA
LAVQWSQLISIWKFVVVMILGVIIGTVSGKKLLEKLPELVFKKTVAAILLLIGVLVLIEH